MEKDNSSAKQCEDMVKELIEMTLEELWELFPIRLSAPKEEWEKIYLEMETRLKALLTGAIERISHIGSTAVPGIWAKDIIDILIELPQNGSIEDVVSILEANGFLRMSGSANRVSLNCGYTKNGYSPPVCHIHLRYAGDNDELYFRDYLIDHPAVSAEYEKLKLGLQKLYKYNRDVYTDAKTQFVRRWTEKAKKEYAGRYGNEHV